MDDLRIEDCLPAMWGLLTCPRKLFAERTWLTYVDMLIDMQWAISRDIITWNAKVLKWMNLGQHIRAECIMTTNLSHSRVEDSLISYHCSGLKIREAMPGCPQSAATFVDEAVVGPVSRDLADLPTTALGFRGDTLTADLPTSITGHSILPRQPNRRPLEMTC